MVGGTPKPFACTHEGCSMTFTNEDHLNVHQKKHEMDLNLSLGNKTNIFVADQTPTPTRFLRNCEEVGLFQDLQNVNPFEETFRRAVELVKTGSLPEPDLPADDTLHTPHVFPLLTEENSIYSQNCADLPVSNNTKSVSNDSVLTKDLDLTKIENENIFENNSNKNAAEHTLLNNNIKINSHISDSHEHDYALEISKNESNEKKIDCSSNTPTKLKLKQVLLKNKKRSITVNVTQEKNIPQTVYFTPINIHNNKILSTVASTSTVSSNVIPILTSNIMKLPIMTTPITINNISQPNILKQKVDITKSRKNKNIISKNNSSRKDILERNRVAAIRCRQKRKKWITNLENSYEKVCKHNNDLQKEVSNLKNEVLQLKTLLLAHKDCSVTRSMVMGEKIVIEPTQIVNIQVPQSNEVTKKRFVLPKEKIDNGQASKIKILKLNPTTIDVNDISFLTTQNKKSVIVVNAAHSDLSNNSLT